MRKKIHSAGRRRVLPVLLCLLLTGCGLQGEDVFNSILTPEETYEKTDVSGVLVSDADDLYGEPNDGVAVVYLAVGLGNEADGTDHTWTEINSSPLEEQGTIPYQCEAVFQMGDENAPTQGSFGYGEVTANAVVRLQGANASRRQQKSYRISIKDGKGSLDGMKTVVLSKSFTDPLRITNKLCYELMEDIPSLLSTRTRLVHLYVKDTSSGEDTLYQDYGLYTMAEPINKTYLKNRHLDDDGALYKANDFDFASHEDVITLATSPQFREDAFESLLESKGSDDHAKLLAMLKAVNDPNTPIQEVLDAYFDRDNLYAWLAFNILTGNKDTSTKNYYLYSPTGSEKFYFISWDNDGAFRADYEELRAPGQSAAWDTGIFSFYDNVLFARILEDDACISSLSAAVDTLYETYLTEPVVSSAMSRLTALAEEHVYSLPDKTFARVTQTQYDILAAGIHGQIVRNYYAYYDSLELPAPFHIREPETQADGSLRLFWEDAARDKSVTYRVTLDDSWDFAAPLLSKSGLSSTEWVIDPLPAGQYFLSVTAQTADGKSQIAYETYSTEVKTTVYGVLCFYVLPDGSVHASYFNEGE
ncbi:CotH kinase family protein [Oscillibacter sp.]|uniref:CotH kinase family protein n=1 Tax=Oscillibacter sp. TaxID=1945593 RepID=UPI001B40A27E|nr:CotH kinase family protein [Oscillibacter sp.]MBP3508243.1 CotH kinase family protein [Oscillibacter sp.]